MPLWVSAEIKLTNADRADEAALELQKLVAATHEEPGCLKFEIHPHLDDPQLFTLWEIWKTPQDLEVHYAAAHTRHYFDLNLTEVLQVRKMAAPLEGEPQP